MRITDNMRFSTVQQTLGDLRSRQADVSRQISTGRRVNDPSDDPVAAAALSRLRAQAARTADYKKTIDIVRGDVTLSERTLAEASGVMAKARELAVQGANGSLTAQDRGLLANEVAALKEQLVASANTRGARGYLFSGSQTSTAALDAAGNYQGDTSEHRVEIAPGVVNSVSVTGSQAFTAAGGVDAFAVLDGLEQALRANDSQLISGTLGDLEASRAQIVRAQADTGLMLNRLDAADEALSVTEVELARRQGELGDADVFSAITELTSLSTAIEQAIGVARLTFDNDRALF
jgi:flagellar hook-associated protein 3 FlgL